MPIRVVSYRIVCGATQFDEKFRPNLYMYVCIYIYIERERDVYTHLFMCVCIYIYIYINPHEHLSHSFLQRVHAASYHIAMRQMLARRAIEHHIASGVVILSCDKNTLERQSGRRKSQVCRNLSHPCTHLLPSVLRCSCMSASARPFVRSSRPSPANATSYGQFNARHP